MQEERSREHDSVNTVNVQGSQIRERPVQRRIVTLYVAKQISYHFYRVAVNQL